MKSKAVVCAILALSLTTGGFAFAQGKSDRDERGRNDDRQRGGERDRADNRGDMRGDMRGDNRGENEGRPQGRRDPPGQVKQQQRREERREERGERGAGPNHQFYRGERLPAEYRHRQYVVDDWRGHRLSAPPRGYQWVQTGGDYVLVAIATGIIMQLFLNN
jgi:Ni/Co efflux regulator RcnB